jgi:DNA invertase Pin-like site-specific DNA recombinase
MKAALYARVSTADQHPEAQLAPLREYAARRGLEAVEFVDHGVSGAKAKRPALGAMLVAARRREVDVVVCQKLDRLARSSRHLANLAADLEAWGVDLVVFDQDLDSSTPSGKLLFTVLGAIAEFERDLVRERTKAGLVAAARRGRYPGRPRALDARGLTRARRLAAQGQPVREIADVLGCSKSAVHRALRS